MNQQQNTFPQDIKPRAHFPGASSLFEQLDKRVFILLRDGKKLIGILRSYDQFANMALEDTVERIAVGDCFGDLPLGLYIVRGENVALMGEMDDEKEQELLKNKILKEVSLEKISEMAKKEQEEKLLERKLQEKLLRKKGIILNREEM